MSPWHERGCPRATLPPHAAPTASPKKTVRAPRTQRFPAAWVSSRWPRRATAFFWHRWLRPALKSVGLPRGPRPWRRAPVGGATRPALRLQDDWPLGHTTVRGPTRQPWALGSLSGSQRSRGPGPPKRGRPPRPSRKPRRPSNGAKATWAARLRKPKNALWGAPPNAPVSLAPAAPTLDAARREPARLCPPRAQGQARLRGIGHASHCVARGSAGDVGTAPASPPRSTDTARRCAPLPSLQGSASAAWSALSKPPGWGRPCQRPSHAAPALSLRRSLSSP